MFSAVAVGHNIVIPCGQLSRLQTAVHKLKVLSGNIMKTKFAPSQTTKILSGKDCFGAYGAIFLANNTRPVHGPGQTATPVNKGGSQFDWTNLGKLTFSEFFFQGDWADGSGGADMGTGDTIKLAATGADAKIEDGAPQPLQSAFQAGGVDYVGGANSHALTAFNTTTEKSRLG